MKKALQFILIFLSVFFLENSLLSVFDFPTPNLSLIFALLSGVYLGTSKGAVAGLSIGLLGDILFSYPVGIRALLLFLAGALGGVISEFALKKKFFLIIIMFSLSAVYIFMRYLIYSFFLSGVSFGDYLQWKYLITIGEDVLISILADLVFAKLFEAKELSFDS